MSEIRLDASTEAAIAESHDGAAARITALAGSIPSVEGGYATPALVEILAAVLGTADDLALVNEVAAEQVRQVGEALGGTDEAVAGAFGTMRGGS